MSKSRRKSDLGFHEVRQMEFKAASHTSPLLVQRDGVEECFRFMTKHGPCADVYEIPFAAQKDLIAFLEGRILGDKAQIDNIGE